MPFSLAALRRSTGIRATRASTPDAGPGVYAALDDLAALETAARNFTFLHRQPVHSLLSGRHASRVRGRGLAFEELREYLPGDDIRTMDWRVTARAAKPFVRVYADEKDRPALFVVDQRINMFFGTRRAMKSVAAAEVAALGAWRVLSQGDRVGGIVFNDSRVDELRPQRSRAAVLRLLQTVATQNAELRADTAVAAAPGRLDEALAAAARVATHDHLVIIASDLDGHGRPTRDLLRRLARHNDVVVAVVYDPFLLALPPSGELVVSDGELQVELGFGRGRTRRNIADYAGARGREILGWQREIGIPVAPISAAEETAPQIRHLLGRAAATRRRR